MSIMLDETINNVQLTIFDYSLSKFYVFNNIFTERNYCSETRGEVVEIVPSKITFLPFRYIGCWN